MERAFTAFKDELRARAYLEFARDMGYEVDLNLEIPGIPRIDHGVNDHEAMALCLLAFNAENQRKFCGICGTSLGPTHVDGKVKGVSSWANMCESCFTRLGVGIGTGKGQRYETFTMRKLEG